jgi:hypothetical protein
MSTEREDCTALLKRFRCVVAEYNTPAARNRRASMQKSCRKRSTNPNPKCLSDCDLHCDSPHSLSLARVGPDHRRTQRSSANVLRSYRQARTGRCSLRASDGHTSARIALPPICVGYVVESLMWPCPLRGRQTEFLGHFLRHISAAPMVEPSPFLLLCQSALPTDHVQASGPLPGRRSRQTARSRNESRLLQAFQSLRLCGVSGLERPGFPGPTTGHTT